MYESSTGLSVPNAPVTRSAPRPALATAAAVPEEDERSIYPGGGIVPWFEEEELSYEGGGLYDYPTKSTIITAAAKATAVDSAKVKSRSSASLESEPETETELEMSLEADESGLPSPLVPVVPPEPGTATLEPGMIAELTENALEVLRGHAAVSETRPPYSYTALIYMAMHAIAKERIQLGEIYNQVTKSWAYYLARPAETGWKNSIRHNLTVSRCFKKVARAEGEAGKGGYWMIDEALARVDILLSPRQNVPRVSKKARMKKNETRRCGRPLDDRRRYGGRRRSTAAADRGWCVKYSVGRGQVYILPGCYGGEADVANWPGIRASSGCRESAGSRDCFIRLDLRRHRDVSVRAPPRWNVHCRRTVGSIAVSGGSEARFARARALNASCAWRRT